MKTHWWEALLGITADGGLVQIKADNTRSQPRSHLQSMSCIVKISVDSKVVMMHLWATNDGGRRNKLENATLQKYIYIFFFTINGLQIPIYDGGGGGGGSLTSVNKNSCAVLIRNRADKGATREHESGGIISIWIRRKQRLQKVWPSAKVCLNMTEMWTKSS